MSDGGGPYAVRIEWVDARPLRGSGDEHALTRALLDTPRLGVPGSDFVYLTGDAAPDSVLVLRPSGTEPKAKTYVEVCSVPYTPGATAEHWRRTCRGVDELIERISHDFLRQALALIGLDPSVAGH